MSNSDVLHSSLRAGSDDERRASLIQATTALLRHRAGSGVSLLVVSQTTGVPLPEIRSLFPTWTALLVVSVSDWHTRRVSAAGLIARRDGATAFLRAILAANLAEPELVRALFGAIMVATVSDDLLAASMRRDSDRFHAVVRQALAIDIADGREPDTMDPDRGAEQLIALYEGLQVQAMLRPEMDVLEAYDRATARLRLGWSSPYRP